MSVLKEHLNFPLIYTFKIVGDNTQMLDESVGEIFACYECPEISNKTSSADKYKSYSVTVEISSYDELENVYTQISKLDTVRFYV